MDELQSIAGFHANQMGVISKSIKNTMSDDSSTCLSGKENHLLNEMADANDQEIVSNCCGANYNEEAEMCLDCNDHCTGIPTEEYYK